MGKLWFGLSGKVNKEYFYTKLGKIWELSQVDNSTKKNYFSYVLTIRTEKIIKSWNFVKFLSSVVQTS